MSRLPRPDRSDFYPNFARGDDAQRDIGWNEGELSDGRPFRLECWCWDGITTLTFIMPSAGLVDFSKDEVADLLEAEGLVQFAGRRFVAIAPRDDASGNPMLFINVVAGDSDETFVDEHYPVLPFDRS